MCVDEETLMSSRTYKTDSQKPLCEERVSMVAPNLKTTAPIRFFMYEGPELDHGYLRHCPGFQLMQQSAYNERLGEVYLRDALAVHPWRTRSPSEATLFFVPIWEIVSFNVDQCNGTSHRQRMARAAIALRNALSYRKPRRANQPPGYDHMIASTGCIETGTRIAERLTNQLARLLGASIVGRDRACANLRHECARPSPQCWRLPLSVGALPSVLAPPHV